MRRAALNATPETRESAAVSGDLQRLAGQLGPGEAVTLHAACVTLGQRPVDSVPALREFLRNYTEQILLPVELPAILQAHGHAARHEPRELLELDAALAREPRLREFAAASRGVGRRQLHRLRPLRDQRVVQRYLAAVDDGRAHGWHTLVYGMILALYSLPLRQGLLHYAQLTLGGFVESAAPRLGLTVAASGELVDDACAGLPELVESTLAAPGHAPLPLVAARG